MPARWTIDATRAVRLRIQAAFIAACALVAPDVAAAPSIFGFTSAGGPFPGAVLDDANDATDAGGSVDRESASCVGCHDDVAAEWRDSMHAQSFVDPVFRAELGSSDDPASCAACHAPLARGIDDARARLDLGIACAACHVREGAILGARAAALSAPHAVRVVPDLHDASFCGGCHEFRFAVVRPSGDHARGLGIPQQATLREWGASRAAADGVGCVDCHMPRVTRANGAPGHSHRMTGLRDGAFVASSLDVRATRSREGHAWRVRLELRVRDAGHAVPTGDVFRELRVRVSNATTSAQRSLRRHLAPVRTSAGVAWSESRDTRVHPGEPRIVELRIPDDGTPIHYDIAILRSNEASARARGLAGALMVVPATSGVVE